MLPNVYVETVTDMLPMVMQFQGTHKRILVANVFVETLDVRIICSNRFHLTF